MSVTPLHPVASCLVCWGELLPVDVHPPVVIPDGGGTITCRFYVCNLCGIRYEHLPKIGPENKRP